MLTKACNDGAVHHELIAVRYAAAPCRIDRAFGYSFQFVVRSPCDRYVISYGKSYVYDIVYDIVYIG